MKVVRAAKRDSGDMLNVFNELGTALNSPIYQFLGTPFDNYATIILTDFREIEDILTRRTKEFDRFDNTKEMTNPLLREATINMESHDRFKAQRKLWAGVMIPEFVNKVATLHIHTTCLDLIQLWNRKAELAKERPFSAGDDIRFEGFDSIWGFTFGTDLGSTKAQLKSQLALDEDSVQVPDTSEEAVEFPKGDPPLLYTLIRRIIDRFEDLAKSLVPKVKLWLMFKSPSWRRDIRAKDDEIANLVANSRAAFADKPLADEAQATSAMDQVLRRLHNSKVESLTAHAADPDSHLKDELFLFLIAGFETTATALSWAVKYLSAHQDSQKKLREALRATFGNNKTPSAQDIIKADIPYLDAYMAEVLRCSLVVGAVLRRCKTDTSILGFPIKKDALLLLMLNAETYMLQHDIEVAEEKRSETSKQYAGVRGQNYRWAMDERRAFKPERWLHSNAANANGIDEEVPVYDEHAGPTMPFALGPRGCFGKRLAMAKLKIDLTLLVLAFEFLEVKGKGKTEKGKEYNLGSWEAAEKVARQPKYTHVRLRAL